LQRLRFTRNEFYTASSSLLNIAAMPSLRTRLMEPQQAHWI